MKVKEGRLKGGVLPEKTCGNCASRNNLAPVEADGWTTANHGSWDKRRVYTNYLR